ncbi:MAG: molecular chaperone DnaK [Pegethrix bostrychoides GSE-TBD4-15B]|jgi:molecular chaperone DnaK|uniref:Chaperone protein DnaK n=1 Tax=Pegethrix bostrychoides GSE-TBD4-15B TaxID=2839662 RepID=A0A951PDA4_9CYAN|nr:molecular chaperone DnaK [Pegethrix bostrychoides GSE-TBD4-15B]
MGKVVGIDLGTTNSVVAVMEGGKPVVIANAEGMRTTPSVVAFTKDGERLVGQMARRQSVLNPQNTFYGVKRFIGRRYGELSAESKRVPYTIRRDEANGGIKIKCPRVQKDFAPEEISAMVLRKLTEDANRYLGEPVTAAVLTVPAYFNDAQRQATRDAGRVAGLEVLRILNEPTAASLAYGLDRRDNQTILVVDLGGGTFDVSVLDIGDGVFEVRSTSGDTQLGGNDFDKRIVDWLAEQFQQREGIDLRNERQALQRLIEAAEKAKIELSDAGATEVNLPFIAASADGPLHIETRLSRDLFEELCADLVNRLRQPIRQALNDAGVSASRIDEVVLVGGASRMPMVQQLVRSLIDLEPNESVNPDEVVALGAAIQAGILNQEVQDILLLDVTPLSLGLETIGGVMKKLIPRNTTIPVRRSDLFSTSENNQTMVEIHVVQGEREMATDNKSLGRFKLMGIPPAPRGIPQITVSLDIDANGILQVTALDRTTGREQGVTIQGASNLSDSEIDRMIEEAEQFADEDRQRRDRIEKRTKAEALTFEAERQLREVALDFGMQFASSYRRRIENLIQDLRDYLKQQDDRGIDMTQADLRDALYELQREVYQITKEDEADDKDFFGSIRRTLSNLGEEFFGDDDDFYDDRRDYGRDAYGRDAYGNYGGSGSYNSGYNNSSYSGSYNNGSSYGREPERDTYSRDASRDAGRDYSRDDRGRDSESYRRDSQRNAYGREPERDDYADRYDSRRSSRDPAPRPEVRSDRSAPSSSYSRDDYREDRPREGRSAEERFTEERSAEERSRRPREDYDLPERDRSISDQPSRRRPSEPADYPVRDAYPSRDAYRREAESRPAERSEQDSSRREPSSRQPEGRQPEGRPPEGRPPEREPDSRSRDPYGSDRPRPEPRRNQPDRPTLPDDEWGDDDEWL